MLEDHFYVQASNRCIVFTRLSYISTIMMRSFVTTTSTILASIATVMATDKHQHDGNSQIQLPPTARVSIYESIHEIIETFSS